MGNINDRNDPYYSSQPNYRWVDQLGTWVNYDPNTAANQAGNASQGSGPAQPQARGDEKDPNSDYWRQEAAAGRAFFSSNSGSWQRTTGTNATAGEITAKKPADSTATIGGKGTATPFMKGITDKTPFMTAIQKQLEGRMAGEGLPQTSFATSDAERARGAQMQLLEQLLAQAAGTAPSPAQAMLQQAADRNLADASAMAQSQRGLGATAAQSQVAGQRAEIGQEAARDAGILRLQEQMQATQAAGRVAEGLRGQDVAQEQARAQVKIASDNLYQSLIQRAIESGLSMEQAIMQANVAMAGIQSNRDISFADQALRRWGMQQSFDRQDRQFWMDLIGNVGNAALSIAGM